MERNFDMYKSNHVLVSFCTVWAGFEDEGYGVVKVALAGLGSGVNCPVEAYPG